MSRNLTLILFFLATFLQAGAYGLTFLLPRLFDEFGANEKVVGVMLAITTLTTLVTVFYAGHIADRFGRIATLGGACLAIAVSMASFAWVNSVGFLLVLASALLGVGWAITYALCPVVLTRLIGPQDRVRYFAMLSVAVMGGFGLSPVMAAYIETLGFSVRDAFLIVAVLSVVAAGLFFGLISAIRGHAINPGPEGRTNLSMAVVKEILKSKARTPVIMVCLGASVFAGMNNFQTEFATERGLDYAQYFLIYTVTVVILRVVLMRFKGGERPYRTIAQLQYIMFASVVLFMMSGSSVPIYSLVAILFGVGYGVSYPILVAVTANDAREDLLPQTLQFFALTYFIGIFGFPLIAGWLIVEMGSMVLLGATALLAVTEATMAFRRFRSDNV
jgi:MFS family permease